MNSKEDLEKIAREITSQIIEFGDLPVLNVSEDIMKIMVPALARVQDEAHGEDLVENLTIEALRFARGPGPQPERLSEVAIAEIAVNEFDDTDGLYFDSFLAGYRAAEARLLNKSAKNVNKENLINKIASKRIDDEHDPKG